MGYIQDASVNVVIPLGGAEKFVEAALEEGAVRWPESFEESRSAVDNMIEIIADDLGEHHTLEAEPVDANGNLTEGKDVEPVGLLLSGYTNGKASDFDEAALQILAESGGVGVVDFVGEDAAYWRIRLKDGVSTYYPGEIVYPGDPGA